MNRSLFRAFVFSLIGSLLSVSFNANSTVSETKTALKSQAWVYQAWWLPHSWKQTPLRSVDRVLFFDLKVSADGLIRDRNGWPEKWVDFRAALSAAGTPLDLTLSILNAKDFQSLFSSRQSINQLLEQCLSLASNKSVAGLHLDFEVYSALPEPTLNRFRQFVISLSSALRKQGGAKKLSVFLPLGGVIQIYDTKSLAAVDRVVAQGYDAHWAAGPTAGPVAPLDGESSVTWKKAISHALDLGVKRNRLFISYPLYGYEWPTADKNPRGATKGEGATTTYVPVDQKLLPAIQISVQERVQTFGASNDQLSGSSYYQFQKNGQWITGWFEGPWALGRKMDYLREQKLGGMAFFLMGYDGGKLVDTFVQGRSANGL
jgi:spore germination protein YaaH